MSEIFFILRGNGKTETWEIGNWEIGKFGNTIGKNWEIKLENLRERYHWGDPDVDGRIILRWIFRKWEGVVGTGWSWLKIGIGGGRFWVR